MTTEFTEDYQLELLVKATDREFMKECGHLLHPSMFDACFEPVVQRIRSRWQQQRVVSWGQLSQLLRRAGVKEVIDPEMNGFDLDREEVESFLRYRLTRRALAKGNALIEAGRFDRAIKTVEEVRHQFPSTTDESDYLERSRPHREVRTGIVPSGLDQLDKILAGGIGAGDVAFILAPTSGGKTSWLIDRACKAALAGKKVLYLTLEDPKFQIEGRMHRCLTGRERPSRKLWEKIVKRMRRRKGSIRVIEKEAWSVDTEQVAQMIKDEDLLLIDYVDYLNTPDGGHGLSWENLVNVTIYLRNVSRRKNIPVWTAAQTNRDGLKGGISDLTDMSGAVGRAFVARQVLSLNPLPARKRRGEPLPVHISRGVLAVKKNTHGQGRWNTANMFYRVNWITNEFVLEESENQ